MKREWKKINGYSSYEISNDGCVRNIKTGCIIKPLKRSNKQNLYYYVDMKSDLGKKSHKNIHRLVAETFIENPFVKPCVNHIDGNKLNNHVDNLEWVTYSENDLHAFRIGLRRSTSEQIQKAIDATKRKVRNKTTGEEFPSIADAARSICGNPRGISKCLSGIRKRYKGMEFEYAEVV